MAKNVKSWSYSALSLYEKCPLAYYNSKILKMGKKTSPAAERGIAIHAKGENYLLGNIPNVPKEFKAFNSELRNLKKNDAGAETKYCLLNDWTITNWDDWKNGWIRMVLDAEVLISNEELLIIDFKTGRQYDSHEDQANLYATAMLQLYPQFKTVHTEFWYLDSGDVAEWTFKSSISDDLRGYWNNRVAPLFAETEWNATPSCDACKWCDFKETCEHAIKKTT